MTCVYEASERNSSASTRLQPANEGRNRGRRGSRAGHLVGMELLPSLRVLKLKEREKMTSVLGRLATDVRHFFVPWRAQSMSALGEALRL
jgi:hypothetical protein